MKTIILFTKFFVPQSKVNPFNEVKSIVESIIGLSAKDTINFTNYLNRIDFHNKSIDELFNNFIQYSCNNN